MITMRTDVATLQAPTTKQAQSQKGNALIEFALILPVFLTLLFGMITYAVALYDKTILTMATREGARAGAIYASADSVESFAKKVWKGKIISFESGSDPVFTPTIDKTAKIVTVMAKYHYTELGFGFLLPDSIKAETTMRLEKP
jgi:Flp pilus assembly protein TadG